MYLGRFKQGDEIYVTQQVTALGTLNPTIPLASPWYQVYRDDTVPVRLVDTRMAAYQPSLSDGVFRLSTFFGSLFGTPANYFIIVRWTDANGAGCQRIHTFELLPSGSPNGAVITMAEVVRPDARYILCTTDGGMLVRHKNPR